MIRQANAPKHILLVDDDLSIVNMLRLLLETRGYQVDVATSGQEALLRITPQTDLILLDIVLPDQEGFDVCRQLRQNQKTSHIPIIMLSARMLSQDVIEGLYLGADDYLTKPVEYEELIARMEAVMRRGVFCTTGMCFLNTNKKRCASCVKSLTRKRLSLTFNPFFV
ncbi:MAG: response regulator transcription factor [Candidatus Omnitrophota bacterium]|nr:response regulator transcription factor [Candidatus Omnitrophota bacterium]